MIDLKNLTIQKVHDAFLRGDFTARDLASAYLVEIEKKNKELNAYLEVFQDVLDQADEADKVIKAGKATILTGIPFAVKDNILIKGRSAGSASKILEGYVATYDATAISKLKEHKVVFLGRTNMDEFAMGGSTENSAYGVTKNPYDVSRVPGGSSGGSASAVAGNLALVALGSDTGGSIRQPASFCGLVGLKPTYGAVSRYGLMAMGSSLDQIGPFAKNIEDAEIVWNAILGKDKFDSTSIDIKNNYDSKKKIRVGLLKKFIDDVGAGGLDKSVFDNYNEVVMKLESAGVEVKVLDIDVTALKYSLPTYYILMPAEVSSNLSRFDGVKFGLLEEGKNLKEDYFLTRGRGFGKEVRRRIILGTYVLSAGYYDAYYNKANIVRGLIQKTFENIFKEVDVVLTPTTPTPAFKIGEKSSNPIEMYLADIFTVTANIAGIPAISVPSGSVAVDGKKLPLGVQFMASHSNESDLFQIGKVLETVLSK